MNKEYYKESIYKQYRKLKVNKVDDTLTSYYDDGHSYYTNYNLFNTKTNRLSLQKMRSACFADITMRGIKYSEVKNSNYRLDIFVPSCEVRLSKEEVYKFVKHLRCIGKFRFKTLRNYRLNYNMSGNGSVNLRKAQEVYLLQLNYRDFKSMEQIKLLTHTFRYVYEDNLYNCIKDFFDFRYNESNVNKKIPFLSTFYSLARCHKGHLRGHFYSTSASVLSNKSFINNFIGDIDDYDNSAFQSINRRTALHLSHKVEGWGGYYTTEKYCNTKISDYKSYSDYLKAVKKELKKIKKENKNLLELKVVNYG